MKNAGSKVMASASMVALASAHGFIVSPSPRMPGDAMAEACGQQMVSNQMGDNLGNVQGQLQVVNGQDDYDEAACNVWLCKGYKYEDNTDNVQEYTVGEEVAMEINIAAPHTGVANVSVVSVSSGQVIGSALKSWDEYASNAYTIPDDQLNFSIEIPDTGSECTSPGDCVIQWFWDAPDIDQTYEACIDIVVSGGSSSGGSSSSGSTGSSGGSSNGTAAATSSSAPSSSAVVAVEDVASSTSAASSATSAASGSDETSEEADETCEVVYVTASAAAETPASKHKRHARH